jgi:hypothetical protein
MTAQIVFLSLFLGIVEGPHPVALQVSGPVKSVRITLGGREVAVMTQPPWTINIDMGRELVPRELTAVGFDAAGQEIARATQVINLPRPIGELEIALERAGGGDAPTGCTIRWRHLTNAKPARTTLTLDGKPLALDEYLHARLPKLDLETLHVLSAEMRFEDRFVARRELVIESVRSDSVGTELTPIAVRETSPQHPPSWDGCLAVPDGRAVRTAAVEKPRALAIIVRQPDTSMIQPSLDMSVRAQLLRGSAMRHLLPLDKGTVQRMLWPVTKRFETPGNTASILFEPSEDIDSQDIGMMRFLFMLGPGEDASEPLRFADAVAVAGIRAITGGPRRAVVLVLSHEKDASTNDPGAVRRYLASLGVPFFVWSFNGSHDARWGDVTDVSTFAKLAEAVSVLKTTLAEQRIAWVDVDPLTALRLKADERCGIATVAQGAR